jgi:hypothetical protein
MLLLKVTENVYQTVVAICLHHSSWVFSVFLCIGFSSFSSTGIVLDQPVIDSSWNYEKFSTLYEDIYLDAPFCHCVCFDQLVPLLCLELHFCQL